MKAREPLAKNLEVFQIPVEARLARNLIGYEDVTGGVVLCNPIRHRPYRAVLRS